MPICIFTHEAAGIDFDKPVKVMSIAHIICSCDDIDCGYVEDDLYIAFPVTD